MKILAAAFFLASGVFLSEVMVQQAMLDLRHASRDEAVPGESRNAKELRKVLQENWRELRPEGLQLD